MKKNVWQMPKSSPYLQMKFCIGQWSFIGPGSEKKWYSMEENSPQGIWGSYRGKDAVGICWKWMSNFPYGKLSIHYCADQATIETIFRIIVSANQLSLYGAVANMCEECESHHDRSGQPDVVMGQSIVLIEIKAEVPLHKWRPSISEFSIATIWRTN